MLLQVRQAQAKRSVAVMVGSQVWLRDHTGSQYVTCMEDGTVHANWTWGGDWEKWTIESKSLSIGTEIKSGDDIYLKSYWGSYMCVESNSLVHAKWENRGTWENLTITRVGSTGTIYDGDTILLFSGDHTNTHVDVNGNIPGGVKASWNNETGTWQQITILVASSPTTSSTTTTTTTTAAPASTRAAAPTAAPTTAAPTTTTTTTTAAPQTTTTVVTTTTDGLVTVESVEWDQFIELNELRATGYTCPDGTVYAANAVPLVFSCKLWRAAKLHSTDMATNNYFDHTSLDGSTPWDRARAQGTSANGENIAAGSSLPSRTLTQWKTSTTGHCNNMMNANFKAMAVGYAYDSSATYKYYWTQMFTTNSVVEDQSCYPEASLMQVSNRMVQKGAKTASTVEGKSAEAVTLGKPWPR